MFKTFVTILKNRTKIAGVSFLLDIAVGVLDEWQRSAAKGDLDNILRDRDGGVNLPKGGISTDPLENVKNKLGL